MKKVKIKIPPEALVDNVTELVEYLKNSGIGARVERHREADYLIMTIPTESVSDEDMIGLGITIQRVLFPTNPESN